jgi:hypothetical protein
MPYVSKMSAVKPRLRYHSAISGKTTSLGMLNCMVHYQVDSLLHKGLDMEAHVLLQKE